MRKLTKLLIPAILVIAVIVSCTMMSVSAVADRTIYISATGTGDGSSAEKPLGPGLVTDTVKDGGTEVLTTFENAAYADVLKWMKDNISKGKMVFANDALSKAHPLYRGLEALGAEGGTVVVIGDLFIDAANAFENKYAGDFKLPSTGEVVIKGGKDGKLILDHSSWDSTSLWFGANTTIKDIAIEYRYKLTNISLTQYEAGFSFYANGNNLTIDEGVTVTSMDYASATPVKGEVFPNIFGTTRNGLEQTCNPILTVKSGTWAKVVAAGHSVNAEKCATVKGNSTINVTGGKIEYVNCAGVSPFSNRQFSAVKGNVAVNITGGDITFIDCVTGAGIEGTLMISIDAPAKVGTITYLNTTKFGPAEPTTKYISYKEGTIDLANVDAAFANSEVVEKTATPPQTGSPIAWLGATAVFALVGASVVISKKRTRIED